MPGVHGKQRLESRCPIATQLCTRTSVRAILTAVHASLTAVHVILTAVHPGQTGVHRCVSYGTAAFQSQRRCAAVKILTMTRFACLVCTVTSGWKAAVPHGYASVYEDFRAREFDGCAPGSASCALSQTVVHSRQTAVHPGQTTVHRCVSYGTAAFQPQRRCTVVKPLTKTRFTCRVCTVNSGWKAAVP